MTVRLSQRICNRRASDRLVKLNSDRVEDKRHDAPAVPSSSSPGIAAAGAANSLERP